MFKRILILIQMIWQQWNLRAKQLLIMHGMSWHFFSYTGIKVIYPKYYKHWLYTLAYTIDSVWFSLFWPKKTTLLSQNYRNCPDDPAQQKISMWFIWVFIVLGIYNFELASNHRQSCYTKIGAPTLKISSTESLRIFR